MIELFHNPSVFKSLMAQNITDISRTFNKNVLQFLLIFVVYCIDLDFGTFTYPPCGSNLPPLYLWKSGHPLRGQFHTYNWNPHVEYHIFLTCEN